jgi:hypothetical protein
MRLYCLKITKDKIEHIVGDRAGMFVEFFNTEQPYKGWCYSGNELAKAFFTTSRDEVVKIQQSTQVNETLETEVIEVNLEVHTPGETRHDLDERRLDTQL